MITRRGWTSGAASLGLIGASGTASAQEAPRGPVRLVVPFGPGGTTDLLARFLQPGMQAFLGQPVVVENRAGAAGNIAMEQVVRSPPDGLTVFVGDVGTISINKSIFPDMRFDPIRDLTAVTILADTPSLLVTNTGFPPNSVAELVAYVKARPGEVSFASQGSGSINRLIMEMLAERAGLQMIHVPYRGGNAPAMADIMAGSVPMMFATMPAVIGAVRGGRLKALGVTTAERHPALPDVPTLRESGFPDLAVSSWQGLYVPVRTPEPVIQRLLEATRAALDVPGVRARIGEAGSLIAPVRSLAESAAFSAAEAERWGAVVRQVGATAD
jgi:tripartite-type tricarboxylate transporter receptor subunit TctC